MSVRRRIVSGLVGWAAFAAFSAQADHHLMQIEQVIGGVNGDVTAQAVQLRMRDLFQNNMAASRLRVFDANGQNPVLLIDFEDVVPNFEEGDRVLVTTASFNALTTPTTVPDFTMNPSPESYLAAGSLVFEADFDVVWWRLSWGGANYTGSNSGDFTNDSDGNFGPPWSDSLPSDGVQALLFEGDENAMSTNNLADYSLTGGPATFTNNARDSFTINDVEEPIDVTPSGFTRVRGLPVSGVLADLFTSNDVRLVSRPDVFRTVAVPPVQIELVGTSPTDDPSELKFTVESHASVANIFQRVLLFNQDTDLYESVDARVLGTSDGVVNVVVTNNPGRFIDDATGQVKALLQYNALAFTIAPIWQARQDQTIWTITP